MDPLTPPAPPLLKVTAFGFTRALLRRASLPWQKDPAVVLNVPVVKTPLVVVMIGSPLVDPIAPALVMLPWMWVLVAALVMP